VNFRIEPLGDVLRAELFRRETADETREFVAALTAKARQDGFTLILVSVRNSRPIFKVEQYGISAAFREMARAPAVSVALVGDSEELRSAHQYVELLARQQNANLRAFRDEGAALQWLSSEVCKSP
jgi:triosephosphate isomerase